jgi:hypothetical protein
MAKIPLGINGPIVGTVGSVVGSSWKGEGHIKKKYKTRTKKITQKELGNRDKFGEGQFWLQPLTQFLRTGFRSTTARITGFNAAKAYLSYNAWEGTGADMRINPALMKVSVGKLPLSNDLAVEKSADGSLVFSWSPEEVPGGSRFDQVMMMAYDIDNKVAVGVTTGQLRRAGSDTLPMNPPKGTTWHIYMAFNGFDRTTQSDSVYMGTIGY